MLRKIVSLVMALTLALAVLPVPASALTPPEIFVNGDWSGQLSDAKVTVGTKELTIGTTAFSSLPDAVKAAVDGSTISVMPGAYGLNADPAWEAAGQSGWYLPIVQNGLTLQGVDDNGDPYSGRPEASTTLPLIYGADLVPNGVLATQDLIAVFGANVTITGLHLMPKYDPNKSIELLGANPTVKYCKFTPTTMVDVSSVLDPQNGKYYDCRNYGGSLYVNGGLVDASDLLIADNYFSRSTLSFDSVHYSGSNTIEGNVFDGVATIVSVDGLETYNYRMIGTTSWEKPKQLDFTGATLIDNVFLGYTGIADFQPVASRFNGTFTLIANQFEGDTVDSLLIDSTTYGCLQAKAVVESYRDAAGNVVDDPFTITGAGVSYANVWVDKDWATEEPGATVPVTNGTRTFGVNAFAAIQPALDAAPSGATVYVMPGDYDANLSITKPVTVVGQGTGVNINLQGIGYGSAVWIDNTAGAVELRTLTINGNVDNSSDEGSNCIYIKGNNSLVAVVDCDLSIGTRANPDTRPIDDFGRGIITESGSAIAELRVVDSRFHAISSTRLSRGAVYVNPGVGLFTFQHNTVDGTNLVRGAVVSQANRSVFEDNTIQNCPDYGVYFWSLGGEEVTNANVIDNAFSSVPNPIILDGAKAGTVSENTFLGCTNGVFVSTPNADTIRIRDNDFSTITGLAVEDDSTSGTLDATLNYWGEDGPGNRYDGTDKVYPYYLDAAKQIIPAGSDLIVDDDLEGEIGTDLTINDKWYTIGTNAFASLADAVKKADDGDTIYVYPGDYPISSDPAWPISQTGWYLPITQDNLTIQGVDESGHAYSSKPGANSVLPQVYGWEMQPNGSAPSQSLVYVFGDNVTIRGLHFMPKVDVNKTIELRGTNTTVEFNMFTPNTKLPVPAPADITKTQNIANYNGIDYRNAGGGVYVNCSSDTNSVLIADNYFERAFVAFDSADYAGTNLVTRNTFNKPLVKKNVTTGTNSYTYMVGNVSWNNPYVTVFTGADVIDNEFLGYTDIPDYKPLWNRMDGGFTLSANFMEGDDRGLLWIDTTRFGCQNGWVYVTSYRNDARAIVIDPFLVTKDGVGAALAADQIVVDDNLVGPTPGAIVAVAGRSAFMGFNAFASLADAVKAAHNGDTISVLPGNYPLTADANWSAGGQSGWYLPILQNNLTIQGVDESGVPYAAKPTAATPALPIIYGNVNVANEIWSTQSLVAVFGDNVTLTGLALMPKTEVNKTVEIVGANPTVKFCLFEPNTEYTGTGANTLDGGSLYINGSRNSGNVGSVVIAKNYFLKSEVVFDSVTSGANSITDCTFDAPRSFGEDDYGSMIRSTTWSNMRTFGGAAVEGNTFTNLPTADSFKLLEHRVNGTFTLRANSIGGKDGADLVFINTAKHDCPDGTVVIKSWVNDGGQAVRSNITVDRLGIHHGPNNPPDGGGNGGGNGGGGPAQPPVIAGSTSETITTAGGTVNHEDTLALTIPADTLAADVTVTIAPVVENVPEAPGMIMIGDRVFDLTAETADGQEITTFSHPLTITVTLTADELAKIKNGKADARIFYWDVATETWLPLPTELNGNVLTATTSHFTTFAVFIDEKLPALKDIKGNWAEEYILRLTGLGIVGGNPDGTFAPKANLTRTEAAKMLANSLGLAADETYALTFADTASIPAWGKGYVAAVVKAGIMKGDDANRFNPNGSVTRAEFAVMVARALNLTVDAGALTTFTDDAQLPAWAKAHITAAVKAGIIDGLPGNRYGADQACNREQAAKMLCKMLDLMK